MCCRRHQLNQITCYYYLLLFRIYSDLIILPKTLQTNYKQSESIVKLVPSRGVRDKLSFCTDCSFLSFISSLSKEIRALPFYCPHAHSRSTNYLCRFHSTTSSYFPSFVCLWKSEVLHLSQQQGLKRIWNFELCTIPWLNLCRRETCWWRTLHCFSVPGQDSWHDQECQNQ